ncbi:hypothetical protein LR48_Vigan02g067000 [Vigna angularis]|uniref:Uncharacterized protein n=1 Tax=Phaseolus angularis TaxID=3914 RepID=A0A0L9TVE8_PHAAN|nr:hypothetical protein LR48_Vigan02g067000 [Vigna angularis]
MQKPSLPKTKPLLPTKPSSHRRRRTISSPLSVHRRAFGFPSPRPSVHPLRRQDPSSAASRHQRSLSRASHSVAKPQIETLNRIANGDKVTPRTGTVTPRTTSHLHEQGPSRRGDKVAAAAPTYDKSCLNLKRNKGRRDLAATLLRPRCDLIMPRRHLAALAANVKLLMDFAWMDKQGESEFGCVLWMLQVTGVVEDSPFCISKGLCLGLEDRGIWNVYASVGLEG